MDALTRTKIAVQSQDVHFAASSSYLLFCQIRLSGFLSAAWSLLLI